MTIVYLLGTLLSLPLAIICGKLFGAAGVVFGGVLAYLPLGFSCWREATVFLTEMRGTRGDQRQ